MPRNVLNLNTEFSSPNSSALAECFNDGRNTIIADLDESCHLASSAYFTLNLIKSVSSLANLNLSHGNDCVRTADVSNLNLQHTVAGRLVIRFEAD